MSSDTPLQPNLLALMEEVALQQYPASALYVIATPIGNMGDISLRALHVLAIADAVACEDTRKTGALLSRYGLSKRLVAAHEHNEREIASRLIARLQQGERIALVSDAGTPGVSDPGARIVDTILQAGLRVIPLPGPSAPIAALSASGLVLDQFFFVGFLPAASVQRKKALSDLLHHHAVLIFLEAPHRIADTLKALQEVFEAERQIVVAREITKLFEELHRCPLSEAVAWLESHPNHEKGEFVLLLEGAKATLQTELADAERMLTILLSELPVSQAAALAARLSGQKKNTLYKRALEIAAGKP